MKKTDTIIVSARHLGVLRLRDLIADAEDTSVKGGLARLKRELGIKGDREVAIRRAKESLANVANW